MISAARTLATRSRILHAAFLPSRTLQASGGNVCYRSTLPMNWGIVFVPQQEAWVMERMGRFSAILEPGVNVLIPVLDRISYVQSLKEIAIDIPKQSAVTSDNVSVGSSLSSQ